MGGRLDATNVVQPVVSIITPIGLDHQQWLGNTTEAIAAEKAGIIKPGRPTLSAPQSPGAAEVLRRTAMEKGSPFEIVEAVWSGPLGLEGAHQRRNAALAARAIEMSCLGIPQAAVECGLATVRWLGRFQVTPEGWVLDGAHNPHAMTHLAATWREKFAEQKAKLLFSCLTDKDPRAMAQILEPIALECHVVEVGGSRAAKASAIARCWNIPVFCHEHTRAAVEKLRAGAGPVLATGSLYLVGEVLEALGLTP